MQGYKNNRIVFLDWLRVIACFMVMVVHSSECVYSNDYSFSFPSELGRWSVCLINGFVRPAVPLFLIASAYLLIPLRTDTKTFFRKRFMRVVIPFVIWLFMYAVLPGLWGEFSNEEVKNNLSHIFINCLYCLRGWNVSAVVKKRCSWVSGCLLHYSGMLMRFSEMFLGNVGGIHILCFITYLVMSDM